MIARSAPLARPTSCLTFDEWSAKSTGLVEANNLLIAIKKIFKWAVENDHAQLNPAVGVAKPLPGNNERDRCS